MASRSKNLTNAYCMYSVPEDQSNNTNMVIIIAHIPIFCEKLLLKIEFEADFVLLTGLMVLDLCNRILI